MGTGGDETTSSTALDHIRELVSLLAAGADEQNSYLHPCGWTRDEPYEHVAQHPPCMPMGELCDALDDVWPSWRDQLGPALTGEMAAVLDSLSCRLGEYFSTPYADEISTLESAGWDEVRQVARETLRIIGPHKPPVTTSRQPIGGFRRSLHHQVADLNRPGMSRDSVR